MTVSSSTNRISTSGYCYDSAGNLVRETGGCTTTPFTYVYDAENRLASTAGVTYTYDGDDKRVKKDQTSGSTYDRLYWYGVGLDVLVESDLSGNLTEEYVFFGGKRVARRNVSSGNVFYYFADHLGTSRTIVQAGQTSACYDADFYPYGGERVVTNTCTQTYKFTGKERDGESGLDNFGARYNSSWMGRFMTTDQGPFIWKDPQTLNRYAYTRNNPLKYVDPTGNYFVVAADMREKVKQYISMALRSESGRQLVRSVGYNLTRTNTYVSGNVPGARVTAESYPSPGDRPGAIVGTSTTLDTNKTPTFRAGMDAFLHETKHVQVMNAASNFQTANREGQALDRELVPGSGETMGGGAQDAANRVMGELGAAANEYEPNEFADMEAEFILNMGEKLKDLNDAGCQAERDNREIPIRGCRNGVRP